jgi:hypothetical protein
MDAIFSSATSFDSIMSQKVVLFITTAVRTSNPRTDKWTLMTFL